MAKESRQRRDGLQREFDLTEPIIRDCMFVTGGAWEVSHGSVRWVGWVELPDLGDLVKEKRIVARLAMAPNTARQQMGQLEKLLDEN